MHTLQEINISHQTGKGKSSSNMPYQGDMLIPWRVIILKEYMNWNWKAYKPSKGLWQRCLRPLLRHKGHGPGQRERKPIISWSFINSCLGDYIRYSLVLANWVIICYLPPLPPFFREQTWNSIELKYGTIQLWMDPSLPKNCVSGHGFLTHQFF